MSLLESDAASPSTPTSSVEDESWLGELLVLGGGMLVALGALGAAVAWRSSRQMTALQRCEAEAQRLRGQPHNFTASELLLYNGAHAEHPLLLAIKGRVLDVREGADYYGPDAPYKIMAGRDASKAFAMMSLKVEDAVSDLTGVPDNHLKILDDWYDKLTKKYPTVGVCADNAFGYGLSDIEPFSEAQPTEKSGAEPASEAQPTDEKSGKSE